VELVAALLKDKDFTVRENAVMDLGEMRNYTAIPHIRTMAGDENPLVRAAVALAAAKYPADRAGDIVKTLLADKDSTVVLSALRGVRMMKLTEAEKDVRGLLASDRPIIQSNALATLTALGVRPNLADETIKALFDSPSATVRKRMIENMMLWGTWKLGGDKPSAAVPPMEKLLALAKTGPSSLRATALAAVGNYCLVFGGSDGRELLVQSAKDKDPQIRLGALLGLANVEQTDAIAPFLADESELVRLAAIRAAGTLKATDAIDALFDLMLAAPLNELEAADSHMAARDSLIAFAGTDSNGAAIRAAQEFPRQVALYRQFQTDVTTAQAELAAVTNSGDKVAKKAKEAEVATLTAQYRMAYRNIRACARILGAHKHKAVLDQQIALLEAEPTDSPVLGDLIWSLGALGDAKALPALESFMARSVKLAQEYLNSLLQLPPPYVPYSSEGTAQGLTALFRLDSPNWFAHARALATMKAAHNRLDRPVEEALAAYKARYETASDIDKAQIVADVTEIIADANHRRMFRAVSMRLAGEWKLSAAVAPMTDILTDERPSRVMMHLAAWSLYQIDGKERTVGDPVDSPGDWIVLEK